MCGLPRKRELSQWTQHLTQIHKYLWYFLRCIVLFKRPFQFLRAYLSISRPPSGVVELRDGTRIHLSSDPQDIVTVFVIFARRDYGKVGPNSSVLDIGANIGVFSLFAARSGAKAVHSFEPSRESFETLVRNVKENGLEAVIFPHQLAVTAVDGAEVAFPKRSSAFNRIGSGAVEEDCELVGTISLQTILRDKPALDLLKLDCEGGEYDILLTLDQDMVKKIRAIRLEYHLGRGKDVTAHLEHYGFACCSAKPNSEMAGTLWFRGEALTD